MIDNIISFIDLAQFLRCKLTIQESSSKELDFVQTSVAVVDFAEWEKLTEDI